MTIPTTATPKQHKTYVDNIVTVYRQATAEQRARGHVWYDVARDIAEMIAPDVHQGAGVIAAMSARTAWEDNVARATKAFATGEPTGHTRDILDKARRIMAGECPTTVLPMHAKTGHFYRCIVDPNNTDSVVIDRHAHDVAVGQRWGDKVDRGLSSKTRYATLAKAYHDAAKILGASPAKVQATTWTVQVDRYRYSRAR